MDDVGATRLRLQNLILLGELLNEMETRTTPRITDADGADNIRARNPLHVFFWGLGPPGSLTESFFSLCVLCENEIASAIEIFPDSLEVVKQVALDFAANIILHADRNCMSEEVRASINSLSIDEAASICVYTMECGPYKGLNKILRDENRQLIRPFVNYLWLLMHSLRKCPRPTAALVYRGVPRGVSASYIVGSVVTWSSFSSCTTDVAALENAMFLGRDGERTEFHITLTTNRARSIRHLSLIPSEDEILLPPNSRLRVTGKANKGHGLYVIQLVEEACLDPILSFPDQRVSPPLSGIL